MDVGAPAVAVVRHDDGAWFAYHRKDGRTWRLTAASAALLLALRGGWSLGQPLPESLAAHLPTGGDPKILLEAGVTELRRHRLLDDAPAPAPRTWADLRKPLVHLPPLSEPWRHRLVRLAFVVPFIGALAAATAIVLAATGANLVFVQAWQSFLRDATLIHVILVQCTAMMLLLGTHELGHAVLLGAVTGRPVRVGLRLFWGMPQAYTDASALVLVSNQRHRVAVLLGGVTAEFAVITAAAFWVVLRPEDVPAVVLSIAAVVGPWLFILNLLPFFKRDGYFILQDLTGIYNLREKSKAALKATILDDGGRNAARQWWLPLYAMLHVYLIALVLWVIAVVCGEVTDRQSLGTVAGLVLVVVFLVLTFRDLLRVPDVGTDEHVLGA